jgi:hypothetical protein
LLLIGRLTDSTARTKSFADVGARHFQLALPGGVTHEIDLALAAFA